MEETKEKKIRFRKLHPAIVFFLVMLYWELLFQLLIFETVKWEFLFIMMHTLCPAAVLGLLCRLFPRVGNRIAFTVLQILLCVLFVAQLIYYSIFNVFLSVYSIKRGGGQALDFADVVWSAVVGNWWKLLLLVLPVVLLAVFCGKFVQFEREKWLQSAILAVIAVICYLAAVLTLQIGGTELYSPYDLYYKTISSELSMQKLGVLTTMRLDLEHVIFNDGKTELAGLDLGAEQETEPEGEAVTETTPEETTAAKETETTAETTTEPETEPPVDTSPNVMDIDFDQLIAKEKNQTIRTMHEYFQTVTPTNKNEYTGMFEGYNLIYICAEGFSKWAVDPKATPTLYKMVNEGFVFENFYNPVWGVSTSDGEYVTCTGLIPKSGCWSFETTGLNGIYLPFTFGRQFEALGIKPMAYHDHSYTYYGRDSSHPNMGYTFKAVGNGLEIPSTWPESDLEMMKASVDDYIKEDRFHAYYMTVSGHLVYNFTGNYISNQNKALVEDLDYPENVKAYIACNAELDKAMAYLLERLEKAGKADKTLIVINGDHYPYGLVDDYFAGAVPGTLDKLAGKKIEGTLEMYRSNLIIYSPSMEEPIHVSKYCSSLDILPTVTNLLGLEYDSRLLMGKDILSDSDPLLIFNNRSWITDRCEYNAANGKVTAFPGKKVTDDYVSRINKIVNNKFSISASIIDYDYYAHVLDKSGRNG